MEESKEGEGAVFKVGEVFDAEGEDFEDEVSVDNQIVRHLRTGAKEGKTRCNIVHDGNNTKLKQYAHTHTCTRTTHTQHAGHTDSDRRIPTWSAVLHPPLASIPVTACMNESTECLYSRVTTRMPEGLWLWCVWSKKLTESSEDRFSSLIQALPWHARKPCKAWSLEGWITFDSSRASHESHQNLSVGKNLDYVDV